ncbi:DUF2069 domain-containing protein [Arhodomonas sp. SL1]|uniref:DUF2069 domain-containing protein n=1 Tax=Arhodomonas sp. SL1 TaxID=3425691 RepID=UPI003F88397D
MTAETACYRTLLATWTAQFALLMLWYLWVAPPPESLRAPVLVLLIAPWLLPLRGLLRRRRYTVAWSSLLVLAYFIHAVLAAAGPAPGRWLGLAELVITLTYFTAAMGFVRLGRYRGTAAG